MPNLQVRDINSNLYDSIKKLASKEKRSISQEVVLILEKYLSEPNKFEENPTDRFLKLSNSWNDARNADEITEIIRNSRNSSNRFGEVNELFD